MNRRHFFARVGQAVVAIVVAPYLPAGPAPIVIPKRVMYARVWVTPEMLALVDAINTPVRLSGFFR